MTEMKLYKRKVVYKDKKTDTDKTAVNFYLKLGDALIPVECKYFPDPVTGQDRQYLGRKSVMSAFAEDFPERMPEIK